MSLTNINCGNCGVAFCLPTPMYNARVADGGDFSCPNGHVISYRPSKQEKRIAELERELEVQARWRRRVDRELDDLLATRESLIGALKECPGGCGWRSRKQVPRDPVAMGRGLERVRADVAGHLVLAHGARPEPTRELEART
jgi:hypothetical protein